MTFDDRFQGSQGNRARTRLSFQSELVSGSAIRARWAFVEDDVLRGNIASTLQDVHFDVLLLNQYNVFWAPEAMKLKHALVQAASVVEAVLQCFLKPIEDDPRIRQIIRTEWANVDFHELAMPGVAIPEGQRAIFALQTRVPRERLDNNTKMDFLIKAARAVEMIDEDMAEKLHALRKTRNRIHIKTIEVPDHTHYTIDQANEGLELLETFRLVVRDWSESQRRITDERAAQERAAREIATGFASLRLPGPPSARTHEWSVGDWLEHAMLGPGEVEATQHAPGGTVVITVRFSDDGSTRRLVDGYAPMVKLASPPPRSGDDNPF